MKIIDLHDLTNSTIQQIERHFGTLGQATFQPMQIGWQVSQSPLGVPAEGGGYHPAVVGAGGYQSLVRGGCCDLTEGCWVSLGGGSIYSHARVAYVGRRYAPQQPAVLSDGRCPRDPSTPLALYALGGGLHNTVPLLQEELDGAAMPMWGGLYGTHSGHIGLMALHSRIRDAELAGCLDAPL